MKKRNLIIISIIVICVLVLAFIIIKNIPAKEEVVNTKYKAEYLETLREEADFDEYKLFTDYDELKTIFEETSLTKEDFKNNNYFVFGFVTDPCSESNISANINSFKDGNLIVDVSYNASCGVCAPEYIYFYIKIDKDEVVDSFKYNAKAMNEPLCDPMIAYKPIIYLYPKEDMYVSVKLGNANYLTTTYPKYDTSWEVFAKTNGDLYLNGRYYYGLYWEGINHECYMTDEGFIVKGEEVRTFLEEKLSVLGLNEREADEFIIYWLPRLENNKYNYIRFETIEEINNYMPLDINPKPDSVIRVLMDYKPLYRKISVKEQKLITPERTGFTVVEWGGSLILN